MLKCLLFCLLQTEVEHRLSYKHLGIARPLLLDDQPDLAAVIHVAWHPNRGTDHVSYDVRDRLFREQSAASD